MVLLLLKEFVTGNAQTGLNSKKDRHVYKKFWQSTFKNYNLVNCQKIFMPKCQDGI